MDIQLPVMSGIEATKEIRRLERVNHIGVFSGEKSAKPPPEDELGDLPFPSPVIIVALTASSRDSDRNEALAAGCNDFLTKPVGAPRLERKAIEWGCMQALIWTSFQRKKRHEGDLKNGVEFPQRKGVGLAEPDRKVSIDENSAAASSSPDAAEKTDKPVVERENSGESNKTKDSWSTDDGQGQTEGQAT
jgi:osomolarity two-component system, response regulator SSK1